MSQPAQARPPKARRKKGGQRGSARYGRMNGMLGAFLVALVLISAIPVASNRPAWWLLWTQIIGLVGVAYIMRAHYLMAGRRALQITQYRGFFAIALLVPIYAVIQSLPLAGLLPQALVSLPPTLPEVLGPASISVMPDAALLGGIRAAGFILFLMLVIEMGTRPERNHVLGLWLMGGIVMHAIFGIIALKALNDYSLWGAKVNYLGMLTGTFVNRNSFATFLGFGLILAISFAVQRGHRASLADPDRGYTAFLTPARLEILGLWLAVALLLIAIVMTQSRMGLFAALIGGFVTLVAARLANRAPLREILVQTAVGLGLVGIFLFPLAGAGVLERALFTFADGDTRSSIYSQTWGMIMDRPWLGFGYDAFAPAFELYRAAPLVSQNYVDLAHNTYLALWSEQGFILGSIPMVLIAWATLMIIDRLRHGAGDVAICTAALGVVAQSALHSTVDFSLEIPANVFCFLLIVGLAIARERQIAPPEAQSSHDDDAP